LCCRMHMLGVTYFDKIYKWCNIILIKPSYIFFWKLK
jgi:hypothetical protein